MCIQLLLLSTPSDCTLNAQQGQRDHHVRILKARLMKPRRISLKTALLFQEAEETPTNVLKPLLRIWLSDVLTQSGSRAQPFLVPKSVP
jgi:hypothetical protein